jgi:pre-rRNA-processing protein TSR2
MSAAEPPPAPALVLFARGVISVLKLWSVLRLAVDQQWGGPESTAKRTWMASALVDAFEAQPLDQDDVDEMLLDIMAEEFEVEVEDGTSKSVAKDIVKIWKEAFEGNAATVLQLEADVVRMGDAKVVAQTQPASGDSDFEDEDDGEDDDEEDGEDDEMEEDAPPLVESQQTPTRPEPVVDEDGFTLVQGRSRKKMT